MTSCKLGEQATTELGSGPPQKALLLKHVFVCVSSMLSDLDPLGQTVCLGTQPVPASSPAHSSSLPPQWKAEQLLLLLKYLVVSFPRQQPH